MDTPLTTKRFINRGLTIFAACVAAGSCGGHETAPPRVGSITILPENPVIPAGTTIQLSARVTSTTGEVMQGQGVNFSTADQNIVTVNSIGDVRSVGPVGSALITAEAGGVHATTTVQVVGGFPTTLTRTSADPGEVRAGGTVGDSVRYVVTDKFGNGTGGVPVTFSVTEGDGQVSPASAQTDRLGRVATRFTTGLTSGKNSLTASAGGIAQVVLSVTTVPGSVFITAVAPDLIVPGTTVTITGSGFDPNAGGDAVTIDGVSTAVTSASSTQLVLTAPFQLPCTPTHHGRIQVTTVDGGAVATQMIRAGTLRTMDVGAEALLAGGAETNCTELSPASGHYAVNVLNLGSVPLDVTPFHFTGATSPPPGGTLNRVVPFVLQQSLSAPWSAPASSKIAGDLRLRASSHFAQLEHNRRILNQLGKTFRRHRTTSTLQQNVTGSAALAAVPTVGSTRTFRVLQPSSAVGATAGCTNYVEITARVAYVGSKAIVYEDTKAPLAGQMDSYWTQLGQEFDATMYPSDSTYFGDPLVTDPFTDNDQHLNMVFTPSIPSTLGGFVSTCDFFTRNTTTNPASNFGENFYANVPTVAGTGFADNTADQWLRGMRSTIVHEVKHIASFGARLTNGASVFEESWLEEGMAMVAEEVWARDHIYPGGAWEGNMIYANTLYCDVRPSLASCNKPPYVMFGVFEGLYNFLNVPGAKSLFGRVADNDFAFYYATWSFVRYNADRYANSEASFLRGLTQATDRSGMANISHQTGVGADLMFANWSLALGLDETSLAANPDLNFPSWNLIDIYAGMNRDFAGTFTKTFPLQPVTISSGDFVVDNPGIHSGSFTSYDLSGVTATTRTIGLTGSAALRIAIVRRE